MPRLFVHGTVSPRASAAGKETCTSPPPASAVRCGLDLSYHPRRSACCTHRTLPPHRTPSPDAYARPQPAIPWEVASRVLMERRPGQPNDPVAGEPGAVGHQVHLVAAQPDANGLLARKKTPLASFAPLRSQATKIAHGGVESNMEPPSYGTSSKQGPVGSLKSVRSGDVHSPLAIARQLEVVTQEPSPCRYRSLSLILRSISSGAMSKPWPPTCAIAHAPTGDGFRCEATCSGCAHSLQAGSSRWPALRLPSLVWGCSPLLEGGRA